jgi:ornithine cyclodeaminase/alanine dehydrogenase-like protein (mu-crystallin family)
MLYIDDFQISIAATYDKWIDRMQEALSALHDGSVSVPERTHVEMGEDTLLIMPAIGPEFFATKLLTFNPNNRYEKKPSIHSTLVLNDRKSGEPLAIMDGGKITAMRTAAVSGIGIRYLAKENATTIGIIGAGVQGFHQAIFACSQREITKLYVCDIRNELQGRFCAELRKIYPRIKIAPASDAKDLCEKSEIIITATNSLKPVIPADLSCLEGKTIIAIGSYKKDMRELPDEIFNMVDHVFIDSIHGLSESGDLINPIKKGWIKEEQICPLHNLITGKVKTNSKTRLLKTVGNAAFDLYSAILVYKAAKK